jgi:HAD superfamily hydrolase (TIGR01549 family)
MSSHHPRYKAVIFDIDDTLLTTQEPKWRQHIWVAKHYYNLDLTEDDLRTHWGKSFDELTAALYQNQGTPKERRANFTRHELEFPKQYEPYALEALTALHKAGLTLGLITAMYKDGAMIDLKNVGLPLSWFAFIQGSEATQFHKPDGRVFEPALKRLRDKGIGKDEIVYVGEALSDLRAAQNVGLDFIGVTQGMADEPTLRAAGAQTVCGNLNQVTRHILSTEL